MVEQELLHAFAFDVFVLEVYQRDDAEGYSRRRLYIKRQGKDKEPVMVPSKRTGRMVPPSRGCLKLIAYLAARRLKNPNEGAFERETILHGNWGRGVTEIYGNTLDQVIKEARTALKGSSSPVIETVPTYGYRFVPKVQDLMAEKTADDQPLGEALEIRYLKDDEEGAKHLQRCFRSSRLRRVFNTYFRFEQHAAEYRPETLDGLIGSLTSFVERSIAIDGRPCVFDLLGGYPEVPYLDKLIELAGIDKLHEQKIVFYWLRENVPMMNFIIFEYAGQTHNLSEFEVLFGWGGHRASSAEAVFQSGKQELVDQFRELYDLLTSASISKKMDVAGMRTRLEELRSAPAIMPIGAAKRRDSLSRPTPPSRKKRQKH